MVDSGRQFIPMPLIFATVDAMAYGKMNVLHWHLTDDEYFSFESHTYPQLAQRAAGIPGRVYSHADLAAVIQYAAERGVRVLPEVEAPGHGAGWSLAFPDMLTDCRPSANSAAYTRPMWPLGSKVAGRVAAVLAEVSEGAGDTVICCCTPV